MSWHFSQALEAAFSAANCSDGTRSAPWKSIPSALDDSSSDKMKDTFHRSPFGTMYVPSTDAHGTAVLTWFLQDFLAPTSAPLGRRPASRARQADFTWKLDGSFAKFDLDSLSWKTRQCSLIEGLEPFSECWPRWGSMRDGECLDLTTWAPITGGRGSGLWPTPCHGSSHWGGTFQEVGGSLNKLRKSPIGKLYVNPDFWENLMAWPIGWTGTAPLETDKTRSWRQQHGSF